MNQEVVEILIVALVVIVPLFLGALFVRHITFRRHIRPRIERQRLREANWRAGDRRR